uniref:Uncharacterized protein n=1 Tax=Arundo donax TaxID=35708 RepID=A0A0A9A0X6_ARUDO
MRASSWDRVGERRVSCVWEMAMRHGTA